MGAGGLFRVGVFQACPAGGMAFLHLCPGPGVLTLEMSLRLLAFLSHLGFALGLPCLGPSSPISSLPEILLFRDLFMKACFGGRPWAEGAVGTCEGPEGQHVN